MPIALVHMNEDVRERRLVVRDGSELEIHTDMVEPTSGLVVVSMRQGLCRLDNRSRVRCLVNGVAVQQVLIHPGDRVEIGREVYEVEHVPAEFSDAGQTRTSRRISAARLPAAQVDGRRGFLRRVGRMLSARSQRAGRLRALEEERDQVLRDAGRCALRPDAGLGLPESAVNALRGQRDVVIPARDIAKVNLEHWSHLRQRAAFLDAEIAALRSELGLGPDPDRLSEPPPTLRAAQQQQQDRCFATLDDHDTQQLPVNLDLDQLQPMPATVPVNRMPVRPRRVH